MSGNKSSKIVFRKNQTGFVALMTAIIISIILGSMIFALNLSGFFARFNALNNQLKEISFALAKSCADTAMLKLGRNPAYGGNEDIAVGVESCHIFALQASGGQKIIQVQAKPDNAYTDLILKVDPATLSIVSWQEVPHF